MIDEWTGTTAEQTANFQALCRQANRREARLQTRDLIRVWKDGRDFAESQGVVRDCKTDCLVFTPALAESYDWPSPQAIAEAVDESVGEVTEAIEIFKELSPKLLARMCRVNRRMNEPLYTVKGMSEALKLHGPEAIGEAINRTWQTRKPLDVVARAMVEARKLRMRAERSKSKGRIF